MMTSFRDEYKAEGFYTAPHVIVWRRVAVGGSLVLGKKLGR